MSAPVLITVMISVPHGMSEAFQHHPPSLVLWLTAARAWPAQAQTVRWRIDPISQAMVATCEVQVSVETAKEGLS